MTRLDLTRLPPPAALSLARRLTLHAPEGLEVLVAPRLTTRGGDLWSGEKPCPRCGGHSRVMSSRFLGGRPLTVTQLERPERRRECLRGHQWTAVEFTPLELGAPDDHHPGVSGLRVLEAEWEEAHGLREDPLFRGEREPWRGRV